MSATLPLRARRRWTNTYPWALIVLAGCSNGVVEPIVAPVTGDAGERDGPLDADANLDEGHGHRGPTTCEDVEDWPETSAGEDALVYFLNGMRYSPPEVCQDAEQARRLQRGNPELRCVARLGASQRTIEDGTDGPVTFINNEDELDIRDREERAGIRPGAVRLELLIMNAESPEEIFGRLIQDPSGACGALDPALQFVGVAQRGDLWVLDFAAGGGRRP